ncbi:MAG: hybrid histidine kinase/response regulator HrmK [Cyanomargarita calcarea GSE-NOS-MK-12-04C]|jgi:hypothetical protein|uniref:Circadian input-output histidine kinase CikA n=1 Tax=Cyanomargarita calcarea GSE-NOS-MK-12-04C TaxID=2839659 RepID=A0A951QLY8_9CYAN|nr:hybrid histidine kinase/response regulator HrmK [Cyanomargarita calcarea GSE-NOS-MK-12-04C]
MQQYSSLPEQNSQVDATPTLLATIQQLRAELWLERSLNQLQSCLSDRLHSAFSATIPSTVFEAEIFQTLADELNIALSSSKVAIALSKPEHTVCKVCYVSHENSEPTQNSSVGVMSKDGKKLPLKLFEAIDIENLQHLENQELQSAWSIASSENDILGWIIVAASPLCSSPESGNELCVQLRSQLVESATKQCAIALQQVKEIQTLQQRSQQLESFNQELERTNLLKNQFLANTSHEIRTPLSSILGFTHLLLAQGYDPTSLRHQEYLNIILSSGKHLLALINDILDLSKIEANQLEVQWETVNVPEMCRNVLALVKEKAANKGLKLRFELDKNVTTLVADPLRLKQMLLNLLFNALKFTTKGAVGLEVVSQNGFLHFTVWDTGAGISKEDQVQLFQPYFQIANPAVSRDEGTGLGLAVTRKLAEIHGGSVEVESVIDNGSRFRILIPLSLEIESLEPQELQEQFPTAYCSVLTPNSLDILLVEDDLPNGQMIQTYLARLGYQVTWVTSCTSMWDVLTKANPAVILIDIRLPDGNGLEVVRQLRSDEQYQMIPVIAQTAMAMKGDRESCLAAGVNDYISKPIDLLLLASLVSKYSQASVAKSGEREL